jgi:hypothetical protein
VVFNAIFNTISDILWRSVLLVEETGIFPEKTTDLVTDKTLLQYFKKQFHLVN